MIRDKVLNTIKKYNLIQPKDKIVLGVSGGPDSISMLYILNELKEKLDFEIIVAHINHGIRENAKNDEEYVKTYCEKIGVKFYCLHASVKELAEQKKMGLEETGRKVRYDFFDEILKKEYAQKIGIAHNKNDNAETMIMNILRGSGTNGLRGIEAKQGKYIRPLIEIERYEIENFCNEKSLNPCIDESNFENEFTRNKIRNIVIPYVKKNFNENIIETLERLSQITREQEDYIKNVAETEYKNVLIEEINLQNIEYNKESSFDDKKLKNNVYNKEKESKIILDLKKFNMLNVVIQKKIILYAIHNIFGTIKGIEKVHLEDMIKLCNNNIGNKFLTPNKNLRIVIKNKQIHISSIK